MLGMCSDCVFSADSFRMQFVKAQAAFHSAAAELLTQLQAEISQTALSVESDYR